MKIVCFTPLLLLFLVACSNVAYTPEQAARLDLINNNNAQPDTIRIHQSQSWKDSVVVLASYLSTDQNQRSSCEAVFEIEREAAGWRVSGSGVGCSSPPSTEAVTFGSGTQGVPPNELSYAHGVVKLSEAKWVEITWQDGTVQRADVVNGSYLALRTGSFQMIGRVEALNASDEIIQEIEIMPDIQKMP
jgi:hypothetical protein